MYAEFASSVTESMLKKQDESHVGQVLTADLFQILKNSNGTRTCCRCELLDGC